MGGKGGEEVRSEAIRWKLTLIGTLLIVTLEKNRASQVWLVDGTHYCLL